MKTPSTSPRSRHRKTINPRHLLRCYLAHLRARVCADGTVRNGALYLGNFLTA